MAPKQKKASEELKNLEAKELLKKVEEWRRELFSLRLNATTAHVKNHSQFKKLRKNIARGLTLLGQKDIKESSLEASKTLVVE